MRLASLRILLRLSCFHIVKALAHAFGFPSESPYLLRKEVIQPHLPIRLPCYDFTPIICPTFGSVLLTVKLLTSGVANSHGVTGGVYKARERIHDSMLTCHY
jgi:hypothetical protein